MLLLPKNKTETIRMSTKKRAYISVYNKEGIVEFCRYLSEYGYELIATEGTHKVLAEAGLEALSARELTGYPEPLDGKVRVANPAVYTGIIASRFTEEQLDGLAQEVYPIELVVINLYPFKEDMAAGVPFSEAADHIDEGGVALLDAAAKNYLHTVAVCEPEDYDRVLCDLAAGAISEEERQYFMYKAFSYTASYNALIAQYLARQIKIPYPKMLTVTYEKAQDMRYGENPQQIAAVYRDPLVKKGSLARARQLLGPVLTYNNINDANAALELVKEFDCPAVVCCKHRTPCGAGVGEDLFEAYGRAFNADPLNFKGGIIALNGIVDARIAGRLRETEAEVVLAVGFTPEAMAELELRKELVLLEISNIRSKMLFSTLDLHKIYGGVLVQTYDMTSGKNARCVTERKPTESEIRALKFNYKIAKHARSSAIVVGTEYETKGIGAGQISRLHALKTALAIAGEGKGCVIASDSSFSSADYVELCRKAGITAAIATSCSDETIELCDKYRIAVLCTDERHFKN